MPPSSETSSPRRVFIYMLTRCFLHITVTSCQNSNFHPLVVQSNCIQKSKKDSTYV